MTAIKAGWARKDYGRDRYDVEVSLDDLPDILAEHGVDPERADEIPYSRKLTILRLVAETHATDVYARREITDSGWGGKGAPPATVADVLGRLKVIKGQLDKILADYKPAEVPEPAGT
jgi:hypothetical protein